MRRRRSARPSPPLNAFDAGLALLGVEVLRRLGLPCPSDAEILAFSRGGALPEHVDSQSQFLRERISQYLVDGLTLEGLKRRAADDARG